MANFDEIAHLDAINAVAAAEAAVDEAHPRIIKQRIDAFLLPENQFIRYFRLSKQLTRYLINILDPYLIPPSRSSSLDKQTKVS